VNEVLVRTLDDRGILTVQLRDILGCLKASLIDAQWSLSGLWGLWSESYTDWAAELEQRSSDETVAIAWDEIQKLSLAARQINDVLLVATVGEMRVFSVEADDSTLWRVWAADPDILDCIARLGQHPGGTEAE